MTQAVNLYQQPNQLDVAFIKAPLKHGSKYSPMLHRFLSLARNRRTLTHGYVFEPTPNEFWLGWINDCGAMIGVRLSQAMSNRNTEAMYYAQTETRKDWSTCVVPDFWAKYVEIGRCAMDPEHGIAYIGDETRWEVVEDQRSCVWCQNCKQKLVSLGKVRLYKTWQTVAAGTTPEDLPHVAIPELPAEYSSPAGTKSELEAVLALMKGQADELNLKIEWVEKAIANSNDAM